MSSTFNFKILKKSNHTNARVGQLFTSYGVINTPVFMPVGSVGSVKFTSVQDLKKMNCEIFICNTYHIMLKGGVDLIKNAGGIHNFLSWDRSIISDSGGYQIFSIQPLRKIKQEGVEFQSPWNGDKFFLTPEDVISVQLNFGCDIITTLDECVTYPVEKDYAKKAMELTNNWAKRSKDFFSQNKKNSVLLFGIIQGSSFLDLRVEATKKISELDFDGYSIGGLSVGEPKDLMLEILNITTPLIDYNKPRYLMGVGSPEDIWEAVALGIDMFDCVMPTRNGRNGQLFTSTGKINIKNSKYKNDFSPVDKECDCELCKTYTLSFLNYLFRNEELLAKRLASLHNLNFLLKLFLIIRKAILEDKFEQEKKNFLNKYLAQND